MHCSTKESRGNMKLVIMLLFCSVENAFKLSITSYCETISSK